tara:strand:- start:576 stop:770 length:195 start_codon:yes stop_codon:yes gene_type:complete
MNTHYIASWLSDQIEDNCLDLPDDFNFDAMVEQLNIRFDDQIVCDHLEDLLAQLLKKKSNYPKF